MNPLIETWQIHNRINLYLLEAIDEANLNDQSASKGRTVGQQFAHIHSVRMMWLKVAAPQLLESLPKIEKECITKAILKDALELSEKAISQLFEIAGPGGSYYFELFTDLPGDISLADDPMIKKDIIHFFTKNEAEYTNLLPLLKMEIKANGMIWVSWPKKASKVVTDITEDKIRNFAIETGLVDIKVCAVDETWSGLKLVIPVKDR
jgi:hypothetical protein